MKLGIEIFLISVIILIYLISSEFFSEYDIVVLKKSNPINVTEFKEVIEDFEQLVDCQKKLDGYTYCIFPNRSYAIIYPIGESMEPAFQGRNEVLLCNSDFELEEGGIYMFEDKNITDIPIGHRCVRKESYGCIFKGDNNQAYENVTFDQIVCRVEWLFRRLN